MTTRRFAEYEITANAIGPGTIDVERDPHLKTKYLRPSQPIRRMGTSQEVVSLMLYLASVDAGFITGQTYLMNGGDVSSLSSRDWPRHPARPNADATQDGCNYPL